MNCNTMQSRLGRLALMQSYDKCQQVRETQQNPLPGC